MSNVILYVDSPSHLDQQLRWALRIAAVRGRALTILMRSEGKPGADVKRLDFASDDRVCRELKDLLDAEFGEWVPFEDATPSEDDATGDAPSPAEDEPAPRTVRAYALPMDEQVSDLLARVHEAKPSLVIGTQSRLETEDAASSARRRRIMREIACEVVLIRAGREQTESTGVLVPCARGPHCAAALRLARDLTPEEERFAALLVEPPIGSEAGQVGSRILGRIVKRGLEDDYARAERVVRVHDQVHTGILEEVAERRPGLVVMGASKIGALGQRLRGTISQRLLRANETQTVAFVRAEIPLQSLARRRLESYLQRRVPQLERDARIDLFERVQSNSAWDFDFLALMGLATLIAAPGLIENSAAVIIGAMLVAPLMTPLLGMGLALVQGNPQLLKLASRTVTLGFLLSLVISFFAGLLTPGFRIATPEMVARDWPQMLDLVIAFAAGLAGAYTSSRPSLLAALPGVAIAAALVPPIATAGLALSIGDLDLAGGALLLFLINAVAIVLATTFALWAVGIRDVKEGSTVTRRVGATFIAVVGVLGLYLAIARPKYIAPDHVASEVLPRLERHLAEGERLVRAEFDLGGAQRVLILEIGAERPLAAGTRAALAKAARAEFGADLALRLVVRWEWTE